MCNYSKNRNGLQSARFSFNVLRRIKFPIINKWVMNERLLWGFKGSISFAVIGTKLHSPFEEIIRRLQSCEIKCLQLQLAIGISKYPYLCKAREMGTKLEFPLFCLTNNQNQKKGANHFDSNASASHQRIICWMTYGMRRYHETVTL